MDGLKLCSLIVAVMLVLAGCAAPVRPPEPSPPAQISPSVWWQVDNDIGAASAAATGVARTYARRTMEPWKVQIAQRTETEFIPWFSGYWTQQWLAIKMAWYKLNAEEGSDAAVQRLAAYLQEQYRERVLDPANRKIDPELVREQITKIYVRSLGEEVQGIPQRYGIPSAQFDQHLQAIPAIALAPPPARNASLYQLVHADPVANLPAYAALTDHVRDAARAAGKGPLGTRISPMAKRTSEQLSAKLAVGGGASIAATAFGGVAGMMISLGAAGIGAAAHENERPTMERQLRENLDAALDDMWFGVMEDRVTGVMAGAYYLSGQIEGNFSKPLVQPVQLDPMPRESAP